MGFLGVRFEVGGGGGKITSHPYLELVRIMLEASSLARKYAPICSFSSVECLGPLNSTDASIF